MWPPLPQLQPPLQRVACSQGGPYGPESFDSDLMPYNVMVKAEEQFELLQELGAKLASQLVQLGVEIMTLYGSGAATPASTPPGAATSSA